MFFCATQTVVSKSFLRCWSFTLSRMVQVTPTLVFSLPSGRCLPPTPRFFFVWGFVFGAGDPFHLEQGLCCWLIMVSPVHLPPLSFFTREEKKTRKENWVPTRPLEQHRRMDLLFGRHPLLCSPENGGQPRFSSLHSAHLVFESRSSLLVLGGGGRSRSFFCTISPPPLPPLRCFPSARPSCPARTSPPVGDLRRHFHLASFGIARGRRIRHLLSTLQPLFRRCLSVRCCAYSGRRRMISLFPSTSRSRLGAPAALLARAFGKNGAAWRDDTRFCAPATTHPLVEHARKYFARRPRVFRASWTRGVVIFNHGTYFCIAPPGLATVQKQVGEERGVVEFAAKFLVRPALRGGQPQRRPDIPLVLRQATSDTSGGNGGAYPAPPPRRWIVS